MTMLYRAASVPLLYKAGSCIVKPQWTTRSTPSLKACLQLLLVLRSFPKHFLGGPTTEGSCHIKVQPSDELTCHIKGLSPVLPSTGPSFFLPLPSHRLLIIHTEQTRSPPLNLYRSQTATHLPKPSGKKVRLEQDVIWTFSIWQKLWLLSKWKQNKMISSHF